MYSQYVSSFMPSRIDQKHMYGCESWTTRKLSAEELMILNCGVGEDLRVPWTARKFNQSSVKEISPKYSLE